MLHNVKLQREGDDLGVVPVLPGPGLDTHLHSPGPDTQQSILPFLLHDPGPVQPAIQLGDVRDDNYLGGGEHQQEREGERQCQV